MANKILTDKVINSTKTTRGSTIAFNREWYIFDASKEPLGRMASKIASLLTGKNRADYSKDVDTGAVVVVINSAQVVLTGQKSKFKTYFRYNNARPGSMKTRTFPEQMAKDATRPVYFAVKNMLPKNRHQDLIANNRLKIFTDTNHGFTQQMIVAN
jgi:large subunit ribosomal protein L13